MYKYMATEGPLNTDASPAETAAVQQSTETPKSQDAAQKSSQVDENSPSDMQRSAKWTPDPVSRRRPQSHDGFRWRLQDGQMTSSRRKAEFRECNGAKPLIMYALGSDLGGIKEAVSPASADGHLRAAFFPTSTPVCFTVFTIRKDLHAGTEPHRLHPLGELQSASAYTRTTTESEYGYPVSTLNAQTVSVPGNAYPWQRTSAQISGLLKMTELVYHNGHYHRRPDSGDRHRPRRNNDWSVMKFWDEVLYSIGDLYDRVRRR